MAAAASHQWQDCSMHACVCRQDQLSFTQHMPFDCVIPLGSVSSVELASARTLKDHLSQAASACAQRACR
eukprot:6196251-Pleurochrysis_carterae.AAC.6